MQSTGAASVPPSRRGTESTSPSRGPLSPGARSAGQCPNHIPGPNRNRIQAPSPHLYSTAYQGRVGFPEGGWVATQRAASRGEICSGPSSLMLQLPLSCVTEQPPQVSTAQARPPRAPSTAPDPDRHGFWQHQGGRATVSPLQAMGVLARMRQALRFALSIIGAGSAARRRCRWDQERRQEWG